MSWEDDDARKTEDGELQFPPRPIVAHTKEEEENIPQLLTVKDMKLSPTLTSKLESLRASIVICEKKDCPACSIKTGRFAALEEQVRAEMVAVYDMKKSLDQVRDRLSLLMTYIDTNEGNGTAMKILRQHEIRRV